MADNKAKRGGGDRRRLLPRRQGEDGGDDAVLAFVFGKMDAHATPGQSMTPNGSIRRLARLVVIGYYHSSQPLSIDADAGRPPDKKGLARRRGRSCVGRASCAGGRS